MKARSVNELILSFKKRLTAIASPLANFAPYSNTYALFRSIASVLAEQDTRMLNVIDESFLATATGRNLDKRAEDFGFYRVSGSRSKGSILIKSGRELSLKKGTILSNSANSYQFELVSDVNLKVGETLGRVISIGYGSIYNLPSGTKLYSSIYDLDITIGYSKDVVSGRYLGDLSGGQTQETDSEFRDRILSTLRKKDKQVGSLTYIRDEILKLPYISQVFILNHKPVPGYFSIFVDTKDSKHINSMYLLVNSIKPVGSLPLIKPLNLVPVAIRVECSDVSNTQVVKDGLTEAIQLHISSLSIGQPLLLPVLKNICYQVYPKSTVTSPPTDVYIDSESLLSISSLQVLV